MQRGPHSVANPAGGPLKGILLAASQASRRLAISQRRRLAFSQRRRSFVGASEVVWRRFGGGFKAQQLPNKLANLHRVSDPTTKNMRSRNAVGASSELRRSFGGGLEEVCRRFGGLEELRRFGGSLEEVWRRFVARHLRDPARPPPGYSRHDASEY